MVELLGRKWTMRFNGSEATASNGIEVVLSYEDGDIVPFTFKLGFLYLNNAADAYLIGLDIGLGMGIKHMRVLKDPNLVVYQVKGDQVMVPEEPSEEDWRSKIKR